MSQSNKKTDKRTRKRVLVTGAAGSVGHFLVKELLEEGFSVTALDLPGSDFPEGDRRRMRLVEADITRPGAAAEAVKGAVAVIHAAAIVDISMSWDELAPVNYDATVALHQAAADAGVETFVFFSTGSVYRAGPGQRDEDSPTFAANDYVRTKLEAERYLVQATPPPTVNIIRPALIFGPWGKVLAGALAAVPALVALFTRHLPALAGGARSNWVHAEDVARAAVFLLNHPQPHGSVFNVAGDDAVGVGEVFATALRAGGITLHPPSIPFPTRALRAVKPLVANDLVIGVVNRVGAALFGIAAKKAGLHETPLAPRLDKEALDFAIDDLIFDNRRLKELGFAYRHPTFEEGWMSTQKWYEEMGWVPPSD